MLGKRLLYGAIGFLATGLGILGVWLPGLPTTIFILIALWAFSNASPKLHAWLQRVPVLKHGMVEAQRFQREGTVDPRAKLISQSCAWLSFAGVAFFTHNLVLSIIVGLAALSCSIFMFVIPSAQRATAKNKVL